MGEAAVTYITLNENNCFCRIVLIYENLHNYRDAFYGCFVDLCLSFLPTFFPQCTNDNKIVNARDTAPASRCDSINYYACNP